MRLARSQKSLGEKKNADNQVHQNTSKKKRNQKEVNAVGGIRGRIIDKGEIEEKSNQRKEKYLIEYGENIDQRRKEWSVEHKIQEHLSNKRLTMVEAHRRRVTEDLGQEERKERMSAQARRSMKKRGTIISLIHFFGCKFRPKRSRELGSLVYDIREQCRPNKKMETERKRPEKRMRTERVRIALKISAAEENPRSETLNIARKKNYRKISWNSLQKKQKDQNWLRKLMHFSFLLQRALRIKRMNIKKRQQRKHRRGRSILRRREVVQQAVECSKGKGSVVKELIT